MNSGIKLLNTNNNVYKRIGLHILFWLIFFTWTVFYYGYSQNRYSQFALQLLITLPIDIFATYFTIYYLLPKYLLSKKYYTFILLFVLSAFTITLIERFINFKFVYPWAYPESYKSFQFWHPMSIPAMTVSIYTIVVVAMMIKLAKLWVRNNQQREELLKEKLEGELALLRNQVNPHFLFNTLNNIDSLVTDDPEKASDAIIMLSDIMRYMLYDANTKNVLLEKEIEYLKSYVNLQGLRYKRQDLIDFRIGKFDERLEIAPMLLVPFVENAFKHGSKEQNENIIISLEIADGKLLFHVENTVIDESIPKDNSRGIGLTNVKRRLELLYHNNYELLIQIKNNKHLVNLKIKLQ